MSPFASRHPLEKFHVCGHVISLRGLLGDFINRHALPPARHAATSVGEVGDKMVLSTFWDIASMPIAYAGDEVAIITTASTLLYLNHTKS